MSTRSVKTNLLSTSVYELLSTSRLLIPELLARHSWKRRLVSDLLPWKSIWHFETWPSNYNNMVGLVTREFRRNATIRELRWPGLTMTEGSSCFNHVRYWLRSVYSWTRTHRGCGLWTWFNCLLAGYGTHYVHTDWVTIVHSSNSAVEYLWPAIYLARSYFKGS